MQSILKLYTRFISAVPPIVKKIQLVIGMAAGSFTAASAITWPGKLAMMGTFCGYSAAICAGVVLALQFIQQTVTVFDNDTTIPTNQTISK